MATEREDIEIRDGARAESDLTIRGSKSALLDATNDDTLVENGNPLKRNMITIDDWSQTGRGSHVEFRDNEIVPLEQGLFLGRGAMGDVHEVIVQGHKLALKRMVIKRKLGGKEKREIEILKRLSSHDHIIQLVGTYTHRQFLGLLLYPVAVCDLHTFFEDVEAWHGTGDESNSLETRKELLDTTEKIRLDALGYDFPLTNKLYNASPVYSNVGCLISALSYLHDEKIRHKDLKPSNILLSKDRMWLSDFGSATDFSLLSQSATDNERGTPRYFSPEMASWKHNGRASDIFSLGCVLLEIVVLHDQGTLQHMRLNRSADPAFHANLGRVDAWFEGPSPKSTSSRHSYLISEIKSMLAHDPEVRPTAQELLIRVTGYDISQMITSKHSVFGDCCRGHFVSPQQRERDRYMYTSAITDLRSDLQRAHEDLAEKDNQIIRVVEEHTATSAQLLDEQKVTTTLVTQLELVTSKIEETRLNYSDEFEKLKASALGRNRDYRDNTTDTKISNLEWQLEKHRLEQRIAELETQLGSREVGTPTSSTFGHDEDEGEIAELPDPDTASNNFKNRSFLSASWPRERTRLEAELKNSTIDREYVYDWAIGGLRRETEQEAWARINGKTDDKISSDKQTNMRRNQDIELAENGSQVMSADDETVGRLVPQASFAVQNTRTASPTQQGSKKSLRKRIAIAINPVL